MRPIKFRAWDRKKKQFDTCRNGGNNMSFSLDWRGIQEISRPFKVYQQFIGLHDKNGKEIYEGDIVRQAMVTTDKEWYKAEVIFNRGGFCINTGTIPEDLIPELAEVIGNIYENPELLK